MNGIKFYFFSLKIILHLLMCSFICLFSVYPCAIVHVWWSEGNMREPTLSFYLAGPYEDQTCIFRLGSSPLSLFHHLADPDFS